MSISNERRRSQLGNLVQIGYVTNDLDRAKTVFADHYGVDAWFDPGETTFALDGGVLVTIRFAVAYVGATQFELIEPIAGAVDLYREALPEDGGFAIRFHHLGFDARASQDLQERRKASIAAGQPIAFSGRVGEHSAFFYADALATLGHHIEQMDIEASVDDLIPRL